jgi:NADH-quinone oxidoreductase subunit L
VTTAMILLVAVPALCGLLGLLLPYNARRVAIGLSCGAAGVVLALAIVTFLVALHDNTQYDHSFTLAHFGEYSVQLALRINVTAAVVAILVGVVGLAVQIYSVGYQANDPRYVPYAAQISLFIASMLTVVCANDLIVLLVGWELMGLCSYLLIGHDTSVPAAPRAAVKAFVITRIGDIGFLLGIVTLSVGAKSFAIPDVLDAVARGAYSYLTITAAGLLLAAGIVGKSAQFPLHTWLPDAMAGPTPVSALIHAATMVAAGAYVLITLHPIFAASTTTMTVIAMLGAVTVLIGALVAGFSDDVKRILAYSTMSQLGYLVAILGLSGTVNAPALFHLLSHGLFKALLFLAAGAVLIAVGSNSLSTMGGLRRSMPITFYCMTIGLASAAGLPPLSGFWSKDAVLNAADQAAGMSANVVAAVLWISVPLTAWYCTRLWLSVFFGPPKKLSTLEQNLTMQVPIIALAALVVLLAAVPYLSMSLVEGWSTEIIRPHVTIAIGALVLTLAGSLATWLAWRSNFSVPSALTSILTSGFYVDSIQSLFIVRPTKWISQMVRSFDERLLDGAVLKMARTVVLTGDDLGRVHSGLTRYISVLLGGMLMVGVAALVVWGAVS